MPSNLSNNFIQCIKCNNTNGDFYRLENTQHAGYCSNCFTQVIRQKFSSCLGRNRIFKNSLVKDVLLIYIPNQLESIFLLNFTHLAICGQDDHRKLRINVNVLLLLENEEKNNKQILQNIVKENQSEWRWYATHLSNIFGKTKVLPLEDVLNDNTNDQLFTEENLAKFSLLLANCQSKCIRDELLRLIRTKFILQIANSLNCSIVFLPENADQLAENVLNAICFGRGSTISDISAILDTRFLDSPNFASIQLVRPLHDISLNELEAMKRLNSDSDKKIFEDTKIVETNQNGGVCVQQLTGQFINQLRQSGFPATISTILSVSAKVESERDGTICTLCFGRYQPKIESLQRICCSPCNSLINEMKEEGKTLLINEILNC